MKSARPISHRTTLLRRADVILIISFICTILTGCLEEFDENQKPSNNTSHLDTGTNNVSNNDAGTDSAEGIDGISDTDIQPDTDTQPERTCESTCSEGQYCFDGTCYTQPMLALGTSHTCVLSGTTIQCWGNNYSGQLGTGDVDDNEKNHEPSVVAIADTPVALFAGGGQTCAITKNTGQPREVYCWGAHPAVERQPGIDNNYEEIPTKLDTIGDIDPKLAAPTQLVLTNSHSCARLHHSDGRIRCWGNNHFGQLGNEAPNPSYRPVTAGNLKAASHVTAGSDFSCSLHRAENSVYCWGINDRGQLGLHLETGTTTKTPQRLSTLKDVLTIEAGNNHACAILEDKSIKCWGTNNFGQLGIDKKDNVYQPVTQDIPLQGVKQLALGNSFTCALLDTNKISCAGNNISGQLGLPPDNKTSSSTFIINPHFNNVHQIAAGSDHLCAVHDENLVSCWGFNEFYQVGSTVLNRYSSPIRIQL